MQRESECEFLRHPGRDAVSAVRRQLGLLFADLTLFNVRTMDEHINQLISTILFVFIIEGGVGVFGLILAAIGLAAVITHTVNRRRKEIGIRVALGARARQVLRLVLAEYVTLLLVGGVLGCAGAAALLRGLSAVLAENLGRVVSGGGRRPRPMGRRPCVARGGWRHRLLHARPPLDPHRPDAGAPRRVSDRRPRARGQTRRHPLGYRSSTLEEQKAVVQADDASQTCCHEQR